MGPPDSVVEVVQEKVDNPLDFSRVLKAALQNYTRDPSKANVSQLYEIFVYGLISISFRILTKAKFISHLTSRLLLLVVFSSMVLKFLITIAGF